MQWRRPRNWYFLRDWVYLAVLVFFTRFVPKFSLQTFGFRTLASSRTPASHWSCSKIIYTKWTFAILMRLLSGIAASRSVLHYAAQFIIISTVPGFPEANMHQQSAHLCKAMLEDEPCMAQGIGHIFGAVRAAMCSVFRPAECSASLDPLQQCMAGRAVVYTVPKVLGVMLLLYIERVTRGQFLEAQGMEWQDAHAKLGWLERVGIGVIMCNINCHMSWIVWQYALAQLQRSVHCEVNNCSSNCNAAILGVNAFCVCAAGAGPTGSHGQRVGAVESRDGMADAHGYG